MQEIMEAPARQTVDPAIKVRVLGKPQAWTTWFITQNITDRWGELNAYRAEEKPLDVLEANPEMLNTLRKQMWDELTFVARKDGKFGVLYEVEFSSKESDKDLCEGDTAWLASLPTHEQILARVDAFLTKIAPLCPGVQFCIPEESQIAQQRIAAWAFVPMDVPFTQQQREQLGHALMRLSTEPLSKKQGASLPVPADVEVRQGLSLVINAPRYFRDPEFVAWLNGDAPKFTWHRGGLPGDFADTVVLVDPSLSGEGCDWDMPEHIWDEIIQICKANFHPGQSAEHIAVRLTNVEA